jgi:hypothetical protein
MSCHQLRNNIRRDLKDLVAYTYVTALDGSPTLGERLRVAWIRLVCQMRIDGQQHRRALQFFHQGVGFVARSGVMAVLRPIGVLVAILALGWLGLTWAVELLTKALSVH